MVQNPSGHQFPKRLARRASGTLLLALLPCGLALSLCPAQAQPTLTQPAAPATAPLSPEQQSEIERVLQIAHNEEVCKYEFDLKLDNATIEDAARRIKASFPGQNIQIRQRDARPFKISLDLKRTTVGAVLQSIAALADCKLWVMPDGLLIAPEDKLINVERGLYEKRMAGEWAQSTQAGGRGWSGQLSGNQVFAEAIAQEVKGRNLTPGADGGVKATFASFSPASQIMLQQIADWVANTNRRSDPEIRRLLLSPDSPIVVNTTDPKSTDITFGGGASDPDAGMIGIKINK